MVNFSALLISSFDKVFVNAAKFVLSATDLEILADSSVLDNPEVLKLLAPATNFFLFFNSRNTV